MPRHKDAAFGFAVWGELLRARMYAVPTATVINVYHQQAVIHGGAVLGTAFGFMNVIAMAAKPDDTAGLLGATVAVFDEHMDPVPYIVATEVGDSTVAGYIMVADHPDQEFLVQEDAATPIALASAGMNCDIESTTLVTGTVATGISLQELASDRVSATATYQCKLHYPHLEDTVPATSTYHTRWVVTFNEHYYGDTMAGIA